MIKNWTVITQPVKNGSDGVACRERYLMSIKHPNHKYTSEILNIIGNDKTTRYIALIGEQYRLRQESPVVTYHHMRWSIVLLFRKESLQQIMSGRK